MELIQGSETSANYNLTPGKKLELIDPPEQNESKYETSQISDISATVRCLELTVQYALAGEEGHVLRHARPKLTVPETVCVIYFTIRAHKRGH